MNTVTIASGDNGFDVTIQVTGFDSTTGNFANLQDAVLFVTEDFGAKLNQVNQTQGLNVVSGGPVHPQVADTVNLVPPADQSQADAVASGSAAGYPAADAMTANDAAAVNKAKDPQAIPSDATVASATAPADAVTAGDTLVAPTGAPVDSTEKVGDENNNSTS